MELDPLAGAKMKGISHALLIAEPHPLEAGKTIIVVGTADAVVTIWEADDPRCNSPTGRNTLSSPHCVSLMTSRGPRVSGVLTRGLLMEWFILSPCRSEPRRLGRFELPGHRIVGLSVNAVRPILSYSISRTVLSSVSSPLTSSVWMSRFLCILDRSLEQLVD